MDIIILLGQTILYGMAFLFAVWAFVMYSVVIVSSICEKFEKQDSD